VAGASRVCILGIILSILNKARDFCVTSTSRPEERLLPGETPWSYMKVSDGTSMVAEAARVRPEDNGRVDEEETNGRPARTGAGRLHRSL